MSMDSMSENSSQINTAVTVTDIALQEIAGEPRALDIDVGERLGMKQPLNIRGLIERHVEELSQFGSIHSAREMIEVGKGARREITVYRLNEEQALTIAQISRAPRAKEVRAMLVRVFVAHRRGNLSPSSDLIRRTDGISRMLAHKVTGLEKSVEGIGTVMRLVSDTLSGQDQRTECLETAVLSLADRVNNLMLSADARVAALEYVSVRELMDEAKALQKGRRSLNATVGHELRSRALTRIPPVPLRRCPHSNVWLFPRDFANAYMRERGKTLVSEHNARTAGQGALKFPKRSRAPDQAANGNADAKLQALSKVASDMAQRIAGEVAGLTGEILSDALKLHRHRIITAAMKDGISYLEADGFAKTVIAQVRAIIGIAA